MEENPVDSVEAVEKPYSWPDGDELNVPLPEPILLFVNFILILFGVFLNLGLSYCLLYLSKTALSAMVVKTRQPMVCSLLGFAATYYTVYSFASSSHLLLGVGPAIHLNSHNAGIAWALSDLPLALLLVYCRKFVPAVLILLMDILIGQFTGWRF